MPFLEMLGDNLRWLRRVSLDAGIEEFAPELKDLVSAQDKGLRLTSINLRIQPHHYRFSDTIRKKYSRGGKGVCQLVQLMGLKELTFSGSVPADFDADAIAADVLSTIEKRDRLPRSKLLSLPMEILCRICYYAVPDKVTIVTTRGFLSAQSCDLSSFNSLTRTNSALARAAICTLYSTTRFEFFQSHEAKLFFSRIGCNLPLVQHILFSGFLNESAVLVHTLYVQAVSQPQSNAFKPQSLSMRVWHIACHPSTYSQYFPGGQADQELHKMNTLREFSITPMPMEREILHRASESDVSRRARELFERELPRICFSHPAT
jgi:hypothetical protein